MKVLISHIWLLTLKSKSIKNDVVVRGELIISKKNFKKHTKDYSNERSFAAGMVNGKKSRYNKTSRPRFRCI